MDAAAELGRNPASKHQVQPENGDEQADAGRDCRTRPARPDVRRERGHGNIYFSVQLTTSRIDNLTRLIHTLAICDDHTIINRTPPVVSAATANSTPVPKMNSIGA